ncbi:MAG: hypothetical protein LBT22_04140 [Peptococcaceae bacterium]|jgi:hypothetical protein|nr:hypothetical protein [Peptococcaceae bacterium]
MKLKILRTVAMWIALSLALQLGMYAFLNHKINAMMDPKQQIVTKTIEADIPDANLENVQISYEKDYLAYTVDGVFKVYNLTQKKVVFTKEAADGSTDDMGILDYYWLPDRDTLIYFYAKKNPNPYTMVVVQPAKAPVVDTEDPNAEDRGTPPPAEPVYEKRANNPQITELNTLQLPESSDENAEPEDRYNITIDDFPAGGQIQKIVASTFTNLIYLTVKTSVGGLQLLEIDVMKTTRYLHKSGETITNMAASDLYGTLYIESKTGNTKQIFALSGLERQVVSTDVKDYILGDRAGKIYVGRVENDYLIKIEIGNDRTEIKQTVGLSPLWQGRIPFKDQRIILGSLGEVIIYNDDRAYVITGGEEKEIPLTGERAIISGDGAELIQIIAENENTKLKLEPFNR